VIPWPLYIHSQFWQKKGRALKRLLRILILLAVRLLGAPGARTPPQSTSKPLTATPRILLVRPDHLGDLLMTTPVFHALKQQAPNAHITMMVGPWSNEVVERHPDIDRVLTCPFPGFQRAAQKALAPYILLFSTAKRLRREHFDLAINLRPDFWWGAALLYLARIPCRVGYALEPGKPFLTHALPFQSPEHTTVSNLRLASAALPSIGYPPLEEPYTPEHYPLHFTPTTDEQKWVTDRLRNAGIEPSYVGAGFTPARVTPARATIIVIHPGSGAAVKLWRTEGWAVCADALTKTLTTATSVRIMLTGSKNERPMLEEIARDMQSTAVLVTDANLGQLAALLARAQLVLSVDSGPLHLAVAQGTSTVQIFGPTDPRIFGPWGIRERHSVLASTHRCPTCPTIPCGRLDFPTQALADHPCVRLITEQQVLAAVEKLVKQSSSTNYRSF
jgi:ADP-heptose:LPS heptosyltransferase